MATTLKDVAQLAQVSVKTVSNVVHDHPHVSKDVRRRVETAIQQLDYRPNLAAARQLLAHGLRQDAILCDSDRPAAGVIRAVADEGPRVPEDVAVIALGDSVLARESTTAATADVHAR